MSDKHEPKKKSSGHDPSRRKFLKGVGVAGAGRRTGRSLITTEAKVSTRSRSSPASRSVATSASRWTSTARSEMSQSSRARRY